MSIALLIKTHFQIHRACSKFVPPVLLQNIDLISKKSAVVLLSLLAEDTYLVTLIMTFCMVLMLSLGYYIALPCLRESRPSIFKVAVKIILTMFYIFVAVKILILTHRARELFDFSPASNDQLTSLRDKQNSFTSKLFIQAKLCSEVHERYLILSCHIKLAIDSILLRPSSRKIGQTLVSFWTWVKYLNLGQISLVKVNHDRRVKAYWAHSKLLILPIMSRLIEIKK